MVRSGVCLSTICAVKHFHGSIPIIVKHPTVIFRSATFQGD